MTRGWPGIAAAVAGLALAGCTASSGPSTHRSTSSSDTSSTSTGSVSTSTAPSDASDLLIGAANLPFSGLALTSTRVDANSVYGLYTNADRSSVVVDTVALFPAAAAAQSALPSIESAAAAQFDGAQPRDIASGKVYRAAGTDSSVVAVFAEGRAVVTLAIRSAAAGAVSDAAVDAVIALQDQLIKANVH